MLGPQYSGYIVEIDIYHKANRKLSSREFEISFNTMNPFYAVLPVFTLCLRAAIAQSCDYYNLGRCINVQSQGSRSFPFKPLFPTDPTFVYAIDELSPDEIKIETDQNSSFDADELQRIAFWLEYSNANFTPSALAVSQVGMLFTNATGPVEGGNNGCNSVLGEECVKNLKDVLINSMVGKMDISYIEEMPREILYDALESFALRPLYNLSCPRDLFDDSPLAPTNGNSKDRKYHHILIRNCSIWRFD